jgi:Ser/Thr protein kinase RdoA (MazF antagonist)
MDDVSTAFAEYTSDPTSSNRLKFVLDRLARFHVLWEGHKRSHYTRDNPWLFSQESRICFNASQYAVWLERHPPGDMYMNWSRRLRVRNPNLEDSARKGLLAFLDFIPGNDRCLWERHLVDRDALRKAFAGIPTTFLHGDVNERNLGISTKGTDTDLVLIDWEWTGNGAAAWDVACFLYHMLLRPGIEPQSTGRTSEDGSFSHLVDEVTNYASYYYGQYLEYEGVLLSRSTWERSFRLALLGYYLWLFPINSGWLITDKNGRTDGLLNQIEYASESIRRELGV